MIDWIDAVIPFQHSEPVFGGCVAKFGETGCMVWRKDTFRVLDGSFDSSSVVQTHFDNEAQRKAAADGGLFRFLKVSGNPAKFLQGHNLFGSDSLPTIAPIYFRAVVEALGLEVDPFTFERWANGDFWLRRVDVAVMVDLGGPLELAECMNALRLQAHYQHRGRGHIDEGSLRWGGKSSRETVVKAYDKHKEIMGPKAHRLPDEIPRKTDLEAFAVGKLRLEVELHARHLEAMNLRRGSAWHADTAETEWSKAMEKLTISGQMKLTPDQLKALPKPIRKTYSAWESGRDLHACMSRATIYKHRAQLLCMGIDITLPFDPAYRPKVVSLHAVLTAKPVAIPAWAYGTPLLKAA